MPASTAARILEQATWGPSAASIAELQTKGFELWFQNQVAAPISTYPNQPANTTVNGITVVNTDLTPVQRQFFQNALGKPDQLRQRVAFALSEIWVVSQQSVVRSAAYFPPLLNIFQKDAFGSYQQLMYDVTLNPAMGHYLDMLNNNKATATSSPNENYGRELMQLFTLGLNNLNQDGTLALDQNNNPIPTFTPATVSAISAAFTGWTYAQTAGTANYTIPMIPTEKNGVETQHDTTEKLLPFIGPEGQTSTITLPAGQTAELDLDEALTALYSQPSLAPFVVTQLIQHLVTSNPSPQYVLDVVNVFNSTNGNLQQVVYAILTDPAARAGDNGLDYDTSTFGHFREPALLLANLLRGLNGAVSPTSTVYNFSAALGQALFQEPSVFSYFSPQYEIAEGVFAPEMQLHTTQTAVIRANDISTILYKNTLDAGTTFNISEFVTAAQTSTAALETAISNRFFHGMMSETLTAAINQALSDPKTNTPTLQAQAALYLALTSGEYQVIH